MTLSIEQIPAFNDNYIYLLHSAEACAVVDPGDPEPVLAALAARGWTLTHVLATHHHADHVGGVERLKRETGCRIIGNDADAERIPGIDIRVTEGETVPIGDSDAQVIDVPGHTRGHIAFWFAADNALFCGDTLFSLGCGRLFEGTPAQMWDSLQKLRALPDDTQVYCAHEYTNANADFALSVDPANAALRAFADDVVRRVESRTPTVPSRLGDEKMVNPFLRADAADLQAALNMVGGDPVDVFAEVRHRKDNF